MKRLFILAAMAAAMLFTSCEEKIDLLSESNAQKVVLDINIVPGGEDTKASGSNVSTSATNNDTESEAKINTLQVFVFAGEIRDGYVSKNVTTKAQVECTSGKRDIYCLINAPATLSTVVTKTALLAAVSTLTANTENFEMIGYKADQTIADNASITVPVNRLASKIVVKSIENALRAQGMMTIRRIYISNVAGQINYGLDTYAPAGGTWFNKGGYQSSGGLGVVTHDVDMNATVNSGSKYTTNHFFYAYPNNYAQSDYSATWAPKRTMLVVQIEYSGKLYDYPVDLGVDLEANKMYVINNLKLVNLGNVDDGKAGGADEENPVTGVTAQVTVEVKDWTVVTLGTSGEITI